MADVLSELLARTGCARIRASEGLEAAWRTVVKDPLAAYTKLGQLRRGVLEVVAEGISDESDALELRQMGCEYVQSHTFAAPVPADQAIRMLKEQYPLAQA